MEREPKHPLEIRLLGAIEITASRRGVEGETVAIGGRTQSGHRRRATASGELVVAPEVGVRPGGPAEALREFDDLRTHLRDEVGLAPSSELIELDHAVATGDLIDHSVTAKVGGYELHERFGAGVFAVVHRATQTALSREVAVKTIRAELATQPSFSRSFEREARIVARLEHDAIVPL